MYYPEEDANTSLPIPLYVFAVRDKYPVLDAGIGFCPVLHKEDPWHADQRHRRQTACGILDQQIAVRLLLCPAADVYVKLACLAHRFPDCPYYHGPHLVGGFSIGACRRKDQVRSG